MEHLKTFTKLSIPLLFATVLFSCSVKQEINISADGSGTASMKAVLDESLVFYLESMAELSGENTGGPLFDEESLKTGINENPGLRAVDVRNTDDRVLDITIDFDDIEQLIAESEEKLNKKVVNLEKKNGTTTLSVYIDIDNFMDIAPLFPLVENPLFETFGPLSNIGISEEEYLEMMEYALGEGGGELIKASVIETAIIVPGKIIDQNGGKKTSQNRVVFSTPLIRILLLDKPIEYSVTYNQE